jgi:TolA-binding protein
MVPISKKELLSSKRKIEQISQIEEDNAHMKELLVQQTACIKQKEARIKEFEELEASRKRENLCVAQLEEKLKAAEAEIARLEAAHWKSKDRAKLKTSKGK